MRAETIQTGLPSQHADFCCFVGELNASWPCCTPADSWLPSLPAPRGQRVLPLPAHGLPGACSGALHHGLLDSAAAPASPNPRAQAEPPPWDPDSPAAPARLLEQAACIAMGCGAPAAGGQASPARNTINLRGTANVCLSKETFIIDHLNLFSLESLSLILAVFMWGSSKYIHLS